jgi:hypothetical protein
LAPGVKLPTADAIFADDLGRRQIRPEAFRDDLALLLRCPNTSALASRDDLDARTASALMTYPVLWSNRHKILLSCCDINELREAAVGHNRLRYKSLNSLLNLMVWWWLLHNDGNSCCRRER